MVTRTSPLDELTERQREVLALVARGLTNGQIATHLGISLDGAKWHVSEIISRLGVSSREEAAAIWRYERRPLVRAGHWVAGLALKPIAAAATGSLVVATGIAVAVALVITMQTGDDTPPAGNETPPAETTPTVDDADTPEPVPTPTAVGFGIDQEVEVQPSDARTGIPGVDRFLDARQTGDSAEIHELVTFHPTPCTTVEYGIRCPNGSDPGSAVDAFPWWGCHGAWSNQGTPEQVADFIWGRSGDLHAVLHVDPATLVPSLPAEARIAAVFQERIEGGYFGWAVLMAEDGRLFAWVATCATDVPGLLQIHFPSAEQIFPS